MKKGAIIFLTIFLFSTSLSAKSYVYYEGVRNKVSDCVQGLICYVIAQKMLSTLPKNFYTKENSKREYIHSAKALYKDIKKTLELFSIDDFDKAFTEEYLNFFNFVLNLSDKIAKGEVNFEDSFEVNFLINIQIEVILADGYLENRKLFNHMYREYPYPAVLLAISFYELVLEKENAKTN